MRIPAWVIFYAPVAAAVLGGSVSAAALRWAARNRPPAR